MSDVSLNNSPRVYDLPNSTYIIKTRAGSVLVNCPPETLKYVLAKGFETPSIILLPPDIPAGRKLGSSGFVHYGINYASVEFLLYANFFGKGQKARLITPTQHQAERLHLILTETFEGPSTEYYGDLSWLRTECQAVSYFPPLDRAPQHDDLCTITSLETGGTDLGEGVTVELAADGQHFIFREDGEQVAAVTTDIMHIPRPLALAPARPLQRHELTLQFIGGSDGFDPAGITTCFLAYLSSDAQTQATLFDTAAYLRMRLGNLGLSPTQLSEVVISHLHEDHMAGLPELLLMGDHRVRLLTADLIYESLLRVLSAMFDMPPEEVAPLFDFTPLNPGTPVTIEDRTYDAIYAVHSIPTIAVRVNGLYYSGDMRYDENWFNELEEQGILSTERHHKLIHFAEGAEVLVQDAGGGAVHTTVTPELLTALAAKGQRIILAHTSKGEVPAGWEDQVEIASSGHVAGIGEARDENLKDVEIMETIEACPLFVRLPFRDRIKLSDEVSVTNWNDGEVILEDGEAVDGSAFIVHSGLVEIWSSGDDQLLVVAGRGSSIGERGALEGGVRTNSVVARGAVQLLNIPAERFRQIAMELDLSEAFSRADWMWQQPLFHDLLWSTMLDVALDLQPISLATGETLFSFGELGLESYLLVAGSLDVFDQGGQLIDVIDEPGDFFGGRSVLHNELRNATATASSQSEIWVLPAAGLQRLHMVYPHLSFHLRAVEIGREGNKQTPEEAPGA